MRTLLLSTIAGLMLSSTAFAAPTEYVLDPTHTNITWKTSHFGFSSPSGKFAEVEGKLTLDEADPSASKVSVTVKPGSVLTGIEKFDAHLRSADFFNAEKYPTASFNSTKVELEGKDAAKIYGDLTLLGVTKPIVLHAKLNKIGVNPYSQKHTAGFSLTGTITRSEFGMAYALPGVGDAVLLDIEVEAVRADDAAATPPAAPAEKK